MTVPVAAPRLTVWPSPKSTMTLRMGADPCPAVTFSVKFVVRPTVGVVVGPVIVIVGTATAVTFAVAVFVPP